MRRFLSMIAALAVVLALAVPAFAADGNVSYSGNAGQFVFQPGTGYSPTDLFPELKDVMPGDVLQQTILLRNDADKHVKIKVYMRAAGPRQDSVDFLSQLKLTVTTQTGAVVFLAPPDQTAQLTDWVYLGMLYSGGSAKLDVKLEVPVTLGSEFMNKAGYLDWEFKVEELPVEPGDPQPPPTGDQAQPLLYAGLALGALALIVLLLVFGRKKRSHPEG